MSSYFSEEFLNSLSPPTKLNPYATSFQPRNFERSQSLSEEPSHRQIFERSQKCQFYTPNPIASSGIVSYVNGRFSVVNRRDAQLLELLAPQRPLEIKELCSYCYKRSPKSARHQFKDKENRIICPLVGYKLAALRTYRKSNPSYKEMRDIHRKITMSNTTLKCNELTVPSRRQRSGSLSSLEHGKIISNRSYYSAKSPTPYEQEMQHLEVDYYKKLQNSEKEYAHKSNKEILAYMPISERIVARLHQSISSSDDEKSEILSYRAPKLRTDRQMMSKTIDFSKVKFHPNLGSTCEPFSESYSLYESSKMDSSGSQDGGKSSRSHRRLSLAPNIKNYFSSDKPLRPHSALGCDPKFFKFTKSLHKISKDQSAKLSVQKQKTVDKADASTMKKSQFEEIISSADPDSTLLSSISSSTSIFVSDNSGYNCSNSSREVKSSDEDTLSHDEHSLDTSSRNKSSLSINLAELSCSDNSEDLVQKVDENNNAIDVCVDNNKSDGDSKLSFSETKTFNTEDIKQEEIIYDNIPSILISKPIRRENLLLDSCIIDQLWKIINCKQPSIDGENLIAIALEMWTIHKLLGKGPVDAPPQKLLDNVMFQKLSHRKLSLSSFLKQKLKGFAANISITNAVVKILKFSGLFAQLSRNTLHSVLFWKDMLHIWNRCYNISAGINEQIISEFANIYSICDDMTYLSNFILNNIGASNCVNHTCSRDNGQSVSYDVKQINSSADNIEDSHAGLYLQKILCFPCVANSILQEELKDIIKKSALKFPDSLFNLLSNLKGTVRQKLESSLEELELLDFFFDNRYFIVNQFLKNSNSKIKSSLLFDEEKVGQVRLIIKSEKKCDNMNYTNLLLKNYPLQISNIPNRPNVNYKLWC